MEAKKNFLVRPESGTFRNNKEDCYQYEKAEDKAWNNIPSCCFEACVDQCLGGSNQLLMPKDDIQSTNLIEKIGL